MSTSEFLSLKIDQKNKFLQSNGQYLCSRQEPGFCIDLYEAGNMYIEVYFHKHSKEPVCVNAFSDTDRLKDYISGIDLSNLLQ